MQLIHWSAEEIYIVNNDGLLGYVDELRILHHAPPPACDYVSYILVLVCM